jgi:hypothetical protein
MIRKGETKKAIKCLMFQSLHNYNKFNGKATGMGFRCRTCLVHSILFRSCLNQFTPCNEILTSRMEAMPVVMSN